MPLMSALTLSLVNVSPFLHDEALRWRNNLLPTTSLVPRRTKVLIAMLGAMASHAVHVALFGLPYYFLRDRLGLGGFGGQFRGVFPVYPYFAMESYRSIGSGDIYHLPPCAWAPASRRSLAC